MHTRTIARTAAGDTAKFNTQTLLTGAYKIRLPAENQALSKRVLVKLTIGQETNLKPVHFRPSRLKVNIFSCI